MKSQLINILDHAHAAALQDFPNTAENVSAMKAQLAGKVIVDKQALRNLLLILTDPATTMTDINSRRIMFPDTHPVDVLLRQLNEEG